MVDEAVAKAWAKLHPHEGQVSDVRQLESGEWAYFEPGYRPFQDFWAAVPDPATQPWEWVKAFDSVNIYRLGEKRWGVELTHENDGEGHGDTPEAALEAAIRAWADAGKEAGR